MNRAKVIELLRNYFTKEGRVLSYEEYKLASDTPVRLQVVRRLLGSWARVLNSVGPIEVIEKMPIEVTQEAPKEKVVKNDTKTPAKK